MFHQCLLGSKYRGLFQIMENNLYISVQSRGYVPGACALRFRLTRRPWLSYHGFAGQQHYFSFFP